MFETILGSHVNSEGKWRIHLDELTIHDRFLSLKLHDSTSAVHPESAQFLVATMWCPIIR